VIRFFFFFLKKHCVAAPTFYYVQRGRAAWGSLGRARQRRVLTLWHARHEPGGNI
jgi:hypothetical protein